MRQIFFYGALADKYGPVLRLRANTVGAVVKLMEANFPGQFMKGIMNGTYRVVAGKSVDDERATHYDCAMVKAGLSLGSKDLHIVPVPEGSGGGGFFKVALGITLIAAAVVFSGGLAAAGGAGALSGLGTTAFTVAGFNISYGSIALFGLNLVLGGIAGMLTPTPKIGGSDYADRERPDERPSFIFNGAVNTTEQGGPVPVIYGRMVVGSTVISGGITAEQI